MRIRRRAILKGLAVLGVGSPVFHRALAAQVAQSASVTPEMIKQAEWVAGLELTAQERESTARSIQRSLSSFGELRKVDVGYDVAPALTFFPAPPRHTGSVRRNQAKPIDTGPPRRPDSEATLAFLPVTELSALIKSRQVSSMELTRLYLGRLKRFDPLLKCVVTLTEELALKQAAVADQEIAAGHYRGPLHGIPWGAKDLIAYPGYPTTWGADSVQEPSHRSEGDCRQPPRGSGGSARGQADLRCARPGRSMVRRADAQPRGTRATGRADRRPARPRLSQPAWSASRSAARHWAASYPPAGPAAPRGCVPRSAASAGMAV